ncbi:LemA family protein [Clostridium aminobutyricum]|uniref:LemA family protein n=1 Tax=Clostridium aminobutyricum TaxID=33953 RepID=A0A939D7L7_CLOAM|nr:LemA family protein [Clostridium aminobutyricum]MBN7772924.1 LemA family protein [Clostridium aminobutyricum]
MEIIILMVVAAIIAIWFAAGYNGFIKLKNSVEEAFSTMDVYLKKRYDLIPNLVETVKGYAAHEAGTLEKVISARNKAQSATTVEDKLTNENILSGTLKNLFALAESYPDLKANTNFLDLQQQLQRVEEDIANSRKYYNAVVRTFNTKCESFPSLIIAKVFNFVRKPMFEVEDETERKVVKVQF